MMDPVPVEDVPVGAPKSGELFAENYRIERILGVGGMGYVMSAMHVPLRQRVAIKLLLPERLDHANTVTRFLREGQAARKIKSQHVARVLDVGEASGKPFIVMEYLDGSDLHQVLNAKSRLPVTTAIDYLLQAGEAVAEAHAMQIVHRDLKPANLFLVRKPDGTEFVKVLDFGVSKMVADNEMGVTSTSNTIGTPLYMSPEQLMSAKTVDARTDVWALGIILFELISGRTPFNAQSLAELGAQVLTSKAPDIRKYEREVPEAVAAAIARSLRREPAERFPSLAEMAEALAPYGGASARASATEITRVLANVARLPSSTPSLPSLVELEGGPLVETPAPPVKRRWPWVAVGVIGVIGLGGGMQIGKLVRQSSAPAASISAAPEAVKPPIAAPSVWSVNATVAVEGPPDVVVEIDGSRATMTGGNVVIVGIVGSVHHVRLSAGGRESKTDVVIAESGAVPARVTLARPARPAAAPPPRAATTTTPAAGPTINRNF
jgi:serine/threonine protein kinase